MRGSLAHSNARAAAPHRAILGIDMADATSWWYSRAGRFVFAVLMITVGLFELIIKDTANHVALGLAWLVVGMGWVIRCQFTPEESRRQYFVGLALANLLMGASYIAGSTGFMHIEFGLVWLLIGIMWGIRAVRSKEASLSLRPPLLPPDEPDGVTPSSGSEPVPGRGISAQ
jgi:hypothetical protein